MQQRRRAGWARQGAWGLAAVAAVAGLWAAARAPGPPAPAPVSQVALLTNLSGVTAPCGCTSRPLGGLDLLAAAVEDARAQGPLSLWVAGPTFYDAGDHGVALGGHRRATADIIAEVAATLAPDLCVLGAAELREGGAAPPWSKHGLPAAAASTGGLPASRSVTLNGHRLGVLTLEGGPEPAGGAAGAQASAVSAAALDLRQGGHEGVVLLFLGEASLARTRLGGLTGVDLVVAASTGARIEPEPLGEAMLVDGGARGEHLLLLSLARDGNEAAASAGRWSWDDGGAAERRPLEAQRERFLREAEGLAAGPAKEARLARAGALADELAALVPQEIRGTRLSVREVPLDFDRRRAGWAQAAMARYNAALCDVAMAETGDRPCAPAATPAEAYVGSAACQACHVQAWDVWQKTPHAHAWATLTDKQKSCDVSCVGCHVVGWERPGGFCHLADSAPFQNVGCENCHGPGAGHVAQPTERAAWGPAFVRDTPEATCRGCHNAEHSDQFDFAAYRPRVLGPGHGLPLE